MKIFIKDFQQLSLDELYNIIKLRVAVFIVEQKCPYEDLDGKDQESIHIWFEENGIIQAYLRVMDRGIENEHVSIGRVISIKRHCGLGSRILQEGIKVAQERFNAQHIYLEAQTYARSLYEKQGFRQVSEEFLLDGIPHIKMLR